MIEILNLEQKNLIAAKISGRLTAQDVKKIHPLIHSVLDNDSKVNFYFEIEEFDGYTLKGFWEDLKIDSQHTTDYGKMVFVGSKKWQEWAAKATDFFTGSEVKFFEMSQRNDARKWIKNL